jgi:hypothetical protein
MPWLGGAGLTRKPQLFDHAGEHEGGYLSFTIALTLYQNNCLFWPNLAVFGLGVHSMSKVPFSNADLTEVRRVFRAPPIGRISRIPDVSDSHQ